MTQTTRIFMRDQAPPTSSRPPDYVRFFQGLFNALWMVFLFYTVLFLLVGCTSSYNTDKEFSVGLEEPQLICKERASGRVYCW